MQSLRNIFQAAPNQDVKWTRVVATCTCDDPARALRGVSVAHVGSSVGRALLGDGSQCIWRGVLLRIRLQVREVLLVAIDDSEDVSCPAVSVGRRKSALPCPVDPRRPANAPSIESHLGPYRQCPWTQSRGASPSSSAWVGAVNSSETKASIQSENRGAGVIAKRPRK